MRLLKIRSFENSSGVCYGVAAVLRYWRLFSLVFDIRGMIRHTERSERSEEPERPVMEARSDKTVKPERSVIEVRSDKTIK